MSKGIHSLSEHECLAAFEPVKLGIELICDEKLVALERDKKIAAATKQLGDLHKEFEDKS